MFSKTHLKSSKGHKVNFFFLKRMVIKSTFQISNSFEYQSKFQVRNVERYEKTVIFDWNFPFYTRYLLFYL